MDEQNNQMNYPNNSTYEPSQPQGTNALAIISLITGILSIIMACCYVYAGVILGIVGIVCAVMSRKQSKSGLAIAGLVCAIIGLVFSAIMIIFGAIILAAFGGVEGLANLANY